jgi:2-C-methyl-D-erythritol 4-phosphate cytidylyltransferase/2-C-methyl-D-erythritol 2,4-cyclodiphosphate synthase
MARAAAVIVAAGSGRRFGDRLPKVYADLCGRPVYVRACHAFDRCDEIERIVLVVGETFGPERHIQALAAAGVRKVVRVVAGGAERPQSVYNGLAALRDEPPDIVCIHDAARPLVTDDVIRRSIRLAAQYGACVTAIPVVDTVKRVDACSAVEPHANLPATLRDLTCRTIVETLDRSELYAAQTPQTFRYDLILGAYEAARAEGWQATDDAALIERQGGVVHINTGAESNFKITTQADLRRACAILRESGGEAEPQFAVGHGYDVHRLVPGRKLALGGVEIPYEKGLLGHSDADVLLHAVADALLGAAGLGDIGRWFPDTDPQFKDADSGELLAKVALEVRFDGWRIANIDATVVAQAPKLAPHLPAMCERIREATGCPRVNVKATTEERLGFTGRGEAIAAHAVASLTRQE